MKNISFNKIDEADEITDLRSLLERSARKFSQNTAFMELSKANEIRRVSYADLRDDVHALGTALLQQGFSGAHIALIGENSYAWALAYYSIINSGAVVVPLDKELSAADLSDQMNRAKVIAICHTDLYSSEAHEAAEACVQDVRCINLGSFTQGNLVEEFLPLGRLEIANGNDLYAQVALDKEKTCAIFFTSGTTGVSKGVMLTQKSIGCSLQGAAYLLLFNQEDVLLSVLPFNHVFEAMCGVSGSLYFGCAIVFCPSVKAFPKYLKMFSPTVMFLVPLYLETFYNKIIRAAEEKHADRKLKAAVAISCFLQRFGVDISSKLLAEPRAALGGSLRIVISGGASLNPDYVRFYRGLGINVLQGYGITECSPLVTTNSNDFHKDASAGRVPPCYEVKIGEDGQVLVLGDNVMNGYLDDLESTKATFRDGWFMTGDLGYLDKDGFLYLTGRCKDVIVLSNGKNIMPQEIEAKLAQSPLISEAVVLSGSENENGVQSLAALIYPDWEQFENVDDVQACLKNEISRINRGLVYYKRIACFALRHEPFEKTTTRKVKRFLLSETLEGMTNV